MWLLELQQLMVQLREFQRLWQVPQQLLVLRLLGPGLLRL
jgi:hypothetical protein